MDKERALQIVKDYEALVEDVRQALGLKWNKYSLYQKDNEVFLRISQVKPMDDDEEVPEYILEEYCKER